MRGSTARRAGLHDVDRDCPDAGIDGRKTWLGEGTYLGALAELDGRPQTWAMACSPPRQPPRRMSNGSRLDLAYAGTATSTKSGRSRKRYQICRSKSKSWQVRKIFVTVDQRNRYSSSCSPYAARRSRRACLSR